MVHDNEFRHDTSAEAKVIGPRDSVELLEKMRSAFLYNNVPDFAKFFTALAMKYEFDRHEEFWDFLETFVNKQMRKEREIDIDEMRHLKDKLEISIEDFDQAINDAESAMHKAQDYLNALGIEIDQIES